MIKGLDDFGENPLSELAKIIQMACKINMAKFFRTVWHYAEINSQKVMECLYILEQSLCVGDQEEIDIAQMRRCSEVIMPSGSFAGEMKFLYSHKIPRLSEIEKELQSVHKIYDNLEYYYGRSVQLSFRTGVQGLGVYAQRRSAIY